MEALKVLTETNMKVSEATSALHKLQEEETQYLVDREERVTEVIKGKLEESKDLDRQIADKIKKLRSEILLDKAEELKKLDRDIAEVDSWREDMLRREINLTERENLLKQGQKELEEDKEVLSQQEKKAVNLLNRAEKDYKDTQKALLDAENLKKDQIKKNKEADKVLEKREIAVRVREVELETSEEHVEKEKLTISKEKTWIKDRRAMLERGFAELRKKLTN